MNKIHLTIIFSIALLFSFVVNEINRSYIKTNYSKDQQINSKSLVFDYSIWSIDNSWYLPQAFNLRDGKGFTLDPENPYMSVRRTPGYSLFFFSHLKLFGENNAYQLIRYSQLLLFALSAVLLSLSVFHLTNNGRISIISGIIYGSSIFHVGWLYYTITEAIHPELIIFAFYFFTLYIKNRKNKWLFFSGLLLAFSVLVRPFDGLLLPFFIIFLLTEEGVLKFKLRKIKSLSYLILGFLFTVLPWTIRNYLITDGEIIPLEKYYQEDPMEMGKGHMYFMMWWSCWGISNTITILPEMITHSKNDSLSIIWVNKFVNNLPEYAFRGYEEKNVQEALNSLMLCYRQKFESGSGFHMPHPDLSIHHLDEETKTKFNLLIKKYKNADPNRYWVTTPLIFTKELIFQSNSSALAILNPEGRKFNFWQKLVKGWMYIFNVGLFASLIILIFLKLDYQPLKWVLIGFPITTLLFLTIFFRHIETRYTLQTYFTLIISFSYALQNLVKKIHMVWIQKSK